ncbi:hypothetical protein CICLE_v10026894mg [Citrus x clementina]|uniref:Uncharacterized protein n=1 Tax=Citrus clementina TaxID=85681 RepID=V4SQL5_CITCL|nr:hypothetical protein CICLE_v10026894mg [Citrus x clementina]
MKLLIHNLLNTTKTSNSNISFPPQILKHFIKACFSPLLSYRQFNDLHYNINTQNSEHLTYIIFTHNSVCLG